MEAYQVIVSRNSASAMNVLKRCSSISSDDELLTTPMDKRWLQDRRVYSIPLAQYKDPSRDQMIQLFNKYTRLYPSLDSRDTVSVNNLICS